MSNSENNKLNGELIDLLNVYQAEWIHRDEILWKQCFRFFSASLAVILLPYIKIWDVDFENKIPKYIFPIIGIIISAVFLYISIQYAIRFSKISDSYNRLIEKLPEEYQRNNIERQHKFKVLNRLAYIIPIILFLALISLAFIVLHISIEVPQCTS